MNCRCTAWILLTSTLAALGALPLSAAPDSPAGADPAPVLSDAASADPADAGGGPMPQPPTLRDLQTLLGPSYVTVSCAVSPEAHVPGTYAVPGPASYVLGPVSGSAAAGYTVTLTLLKDAYAEAFGTDTRTPHAPAQGQTDLPVTLVYDAALGRWALSDPAGGAAFSASCGGCGGRPSAAPPERTAPAPLALLSGTGDPGSLILTGLWLLGAAATAAYLGRRRQGPFD